MKQDKSCKETAWCYQKKIKECENKTLDYVFCLTDF